MILKKIVSFYTYIGSVQKLLGLISEENRIRIDEVSIDPPLQSKEHVSAAVCHV